MKYLLCYLFVMNFISLIMYGLDKLFAKRNSERIREGYLLFSSFMGGFLCSLAGMILFRHKTRKKKFWILNILFMLMWCYIIYMFYRNG